jgi:hypothetical protein
LNCVRFRANGLSSTRSCGVPGMQCLEFGAARPRGTRDPPHASLLWRDTAWARTLGTELAMRRARAWPWGLAVAVAAVAHRHSVRSPDDKSYVDV